MADPNPKPAVLVLEDVAADAELSAAELRRNGLDFDFRRVDTEAGFRHCLDAAQPILILADYAVPGFDGMKALEIAGQKCPDVPFIFVSGAIGEELAIEAIRRGATDYVLKDHLNRLAPAVRRALAEVEERNRRRSAEREVARINRALKVLSECNQAMVRASDEGGLLREVCRLIVEFGGYRLAWVAMAEPDAASSLRLAATHGPAGQVLDRLPMSWSAALADKSPMAAALHTGRPVVERHGPDASACPWRSQAVRFGLRAVVALPLRDKDRSLAVLAVHSAEPDAFDSEELALLTELANDLAFGVITLRTRQERARAVEALRESERKYHWLFDHVPIGVAITDLNGRFITANPAVEEILGRRLGELLTCDPRSIFADPFEQERLLQRVQRDGRLTRVETPLLRKDGRTFIARLNVDRTVWDGQPVLVVTIRDVTERRRLEREVMDAAQAERTRIGQDLHDAVGQTLAGLAFMCRAMAQKLKAADSPQAEEAERISKFASEAVTQTRTLARGVQPVEVKADGLMTALSELAFRTSGMFNAVCIFECEQPVLLRDPTVATQLYYIALEAATNAVRHAQAHRIAIRLAEIDGRVVLTVSDDGIGLTSPSGPGSGMRIMQYRARSIGAALDIRSQPGQGTTIDCSLPAPATGNPR